MTDNDWDNGYARVARGVLLNGVGDLDAGRVRRPVVDDSFLSCSTPASSTCRGRCPAELAVGRSWVVELDSRASHDRGIELAAGDASHRRAIDARARLAVRGSSVPLLQRSVVVLRSAHSDGSTPSSAGGHELGVETFYWDVDGTAPRVEHSSRSRAVVDILEADYARPIGAGRAGIRDRRATPGAIHVGGGVDQVRPALADGTTLDLPVHDEHVDVRRSDVPVGSHDLS